MRCEVTDWTDRDWPGWAHAQLVDANGRVWDFEGKTPIFFIDVALDAETPFPGKFRCDVVEELGDDLVVVSTAGEHVEAADGSTEFTVYRSQLE